MAEVASLLAGIVGAAYVLTGDAVPAEYSRDEALGVGARMPAYVALPASTGEVAGILKVAAAHGLPVTARGGGTGMSGAAVPRPGGIVVSFERMDAIVEIDTVNHVAVVQPGVTLASLDAATAAAGLVYPVFPGENSACLGGNVATNAGGMRAVKYGVTRHQVLGVEAVLASGEVIRAGGKFVKASAGYDLTQLIVGSEGTLALVTEVILRLYPRPERQATLLAPFGTLEQVTRAIPEIVSSGADPLVLEYIDMLSMAAITADADLGLGIPDQVRETAQAYLVVMLEGYAADRLDADTKWSANCWPALVRWTSTCCRPARPASCSRPGRRRSGSPRPPAPTTSSTSSCRARPCPVSSPGSPRSARKSGRLWWPVAGTRATATSTSPCSSPIRTCGHGCCTNCSAPGSRSAGRSRVSTASASPSCRTSSNSPIR